jgi:hypothetical protein
MYGINEEKIHLVGGAFYPWQLYLRLSTQFLQAAGEAAC